ncbi:MAG: hypothetical protein HY921_09150 [Elusimicrobia bacterium]|nr:hypothetical protein [Elusimicrobiota bacterium]
MKKRFFPTGTAGQTAVEYMLTTLTLVTVFAGMYGFLQGGLKKLFISAGIKILRSYY